MSAYLPPEGSMTPEQWVHWIAEQYGMRVEDVVRAARGGQDLGVAPMVLICTLLKERVGASMAARILDRLAPPMGASRHTVIYRASEDQREQIGITEEVLEFHRALLVPEPHTLTTRKDMT